MYAIGPALDRFNKTRYLLNFAGQRSASYYFGIFLADFIIFEISVVLIVLMALILNIDIITKDGALGFVFLCLTVFGFPFITLSYAIGYILKNPETGYKFAICFGMATYSIPLILSIPITSWWPSETLSNVFGAIIPWISLNNSLKYIILPTEE